MKPITPMQKARKIMAIRRRELAMTNARFAITNIRREETGAWVLTVGVLPDPIDVVLSEAEAVRLVRIMQSGFLDRLEKASAHPNYPRLSAVDANIAHGQSGTGLLLDTEEIGSMVLAFGSSLAEKIKHEIDRVVKSNKDRQTGH
jgi:hypothetical protein